MIFNKTTTLGISKQKVFETDLSQLFNLLNVKKFFFMLILINILIQIAITYYVHIKFNNIEITKDDEQRRLIIVGAHILSFVLIGVLGVFSMPIWLKFIIFSLFSVTMGIILEDLKTILSETTIKTIFIGTTSIFVSLFAVGIASTIQLPYKISLALFFALLFLLITSIVQYFIYTYSIFEKVIIIITLLLFAVYIVYTSNNILLRNYNGDFITASFDYCLDIFDIFIILLANTRK